MCVLLRVSPRASVAICTVTCSSALHLDWRRKKIRNRLTDHINFRYKTRNHTVIHLSVRYVTLWTNGSQGGKKNKQKKREGESVFLSSGDK